MQHRLTSPEINAYAEQFTTPETPALAALNRETNMKVAMPIMLSGHLQGAVLTMLSHMIRPAVILEIGTYTGYSAICLAQGLRDGGVLHTIDINEELADMNQRHWQAAGVASRIQAHTGNATAIIEALPGPFDLVFIDADKVNYGNYYDQVISKMQPGGYILADNVLYEAEVLLPEDQMSKNARALHHFNQKIAADPRVEQVLLPVRDGMLVMRVL